MAFDPSTALPEVERCSCAEAMALHALIETAAHEMDARDAELGRLRERLRVADEEATALRLRVTRAVVSLAGDKRDRKRYFEMACSQSTQATVDRSFAQFEAISSCVDRALAILAPEAP